MTTMSSIPRILLTGGTAVALSVAAYYVGTQYSPDELTAIRLKAQDDMSEAFMKRTTEVSAKQLVLKQEELEEIQASLEAARAATKAQKSERDLAVDSLTKAQAQLALAQIQAQGAALDSSARVTQLVDTKMAELKQRVEQLHDAKTNHIAAAVDRLHGTIAARPEEAKRMEALAKHIEQLEAQVIEARGLQGDQRRQLAEMERQRAELAAVGASIERDRQALLRLKDKES